MPAKEKDVAFYFEYKKITPRALVQDNLIYFSYKSPNGVHDPAPLVYVLEKQNDGIYGLNIHYDSTQLFEIIDNTSAKINSILEKEFNKKYPDRKKQLQKERVPFDKSLLEASDKKIFARKIMRRDLEQFLLRNKSDFTFRHYLFVRMNNVSRLNWRV